jgi:AmmeMemoRadiSam system protein A
MNAKESEPMPEMDSEPFSLSVEQQNKLLGIARRAITLSAKNDRLPNDDLNDVTMQQKAGVFVTLWKREANDPDIELFDQLRGCIGRLQPDFPLTYAVNSAALSAATRDPRFLPVTANELDDITIEIAILSPLEEVDSLHDIVVGRDGLVIEALGRRGLLLPKVAPRMGWNREEFLENVCHKAGVPVDTWPGQGRLYKFTTSEFRE